MVLGVQIIGVLFGLFMLYLTFLHRKKKEFTLKEFVGWVAAWLVFLLVTLFPASIDSVVKRAGFVRTLDALIIVGFLFLIGMMFYIYSIVRVVQNRTEEIVRKVAIERAEE